MQSDRRETGGAYAARDKDLASENTGVSDDKLVSTAPGLEPDRARQRAAHKARLTMIIRFLLPTSTYVYIRRIESNKVQIKVQHEV